VAAVEEACEVAAITQAHDCGRVVEPGSARALADGILAFYRDRDMTLRCGRHAREAGLLFDRKTQVARYLHVFEAVVRERRRPTP
jgi:hypothetical protein